MKVTFRIVGRDMSPSGLSVPLSSNDAVSATAYTLLPAQLRPLDPFSGPLCSMVPFLEFFSVSIRVGKHSGSLRHMNPSNRHE